ncbi:hypothetical protein GGF31_004135 [Allomyces arbusculus]|nr:hypothetical protein GGF31_004135 [Allomyces arbusculus]
MSPRPSRSDSSGHADEPSTLVKILGVIFGIMFLLIFVNAIGLGQIQQRPEKRAENIEKKFRLERGPPEDEDGDEIMPKTEYWYAWFAAKARGQLQPASALNSGEITISMPSPPPPPYLTDGGKSTIAPPQYTTTQPTGQVSAPPVCARGILATGDFDENGHCVIATARCRPYDVDGKHPGIVANTKGTELQFHRVAAHAFVEPGVKRGARLEVRFPRSIVAPADTQEIDEGLKTVNKVVAANRPSLLVLRLFSILVLALWLGGIAIFLNAILAKSNDRMWVTGPLHWPGKLEQELVGMIVIVLGWHVLIIGVWYEMRLAIATRVAVAQLNHDGTRYRWHFCMPPAATGHPKSYVFSPLRLGQAPIMAGTLVCLIYGGMPLPCCCCDDDDDKNKEKETGPIWESWAECLETEWIISVRAAPPAGYAPAPIAGSQPAFTTGYGPAATTESTLPAGPGYAMMPVNYVQQSVANSTQPFAPAW